VALFWQLHCSAKACDFHATIGWTHELPHDIRLAFCSRCFQQIYIQEVCETDDPEYLPDVRVMRVMIPKTGPHRPLLGKTPRERRLRRKELGLSPRDRGGYRALLSSELFEATGTHLFYVHDGGACPDFEQAECPYCQAENAITLGFSEKEPPCPKCHLGTLVCDFRE